MPVAAFRTFAVNTIVPPAVVENLSALTTGLAALDRPTTIVISDVLEMPTVSVAVTRIE